MTIKEIETLSGLPRANIRYYEAEGLITPRRAENGYRDYSQADADTLLRIKLLRALGLTIEQLKTLACGEAALDAVLAERLQAMQQEQHALGRAEQVAEQLRQAKVDYQTLDAERYLVELENGMPAALQQDVQPKQHYVMAALLCALSGRYAVSRVLGHAASAAWIQSVPEPKRRRDAGAGFITSDDVLSGAASAAYIRRNARQVAVRPACDGR